MNTLQQIADSLPELPATLHKFRDVVVREARRQNVPGDVIADELESLDSWWRNAPGQVFAWAIVERDEYGYMHLLERVDCDAMTARAEADGREVVPFGVFLAGRDPDRMAPSEVRKRFGGASVRERDSRPAIVITGRIPGFTRNKAREHAESLGYRVVSGVWSSVTKVWAGERPGKSKLRDAARAGIPVVSEI